MRHVTRIDLATHVIQVHSIDDRSRTVWRHRLSRTLRALGHEVWLIAPQFVAPYRKNHKNDGDRTVRLYPDGVGSGANAKMPASVKDALEPVSESSMRSTASQT
ncbi:MAG: hypothetical protein ABI856_17490 [Nitrospira sp.]